MKCTKRVLAAIQAAVILALNISVFPIYTNYAEAGEGLKDDIVSAGAIEINNGSGNVADMDNDIFENADNTDYATSEGSLTSGGELGTGVKLPVRLTEKTIYADVFTDESLKEEDKRGVKISLSGMLPKDALAVAYPVETNLENSDVLVAYDITLYEGKKVFQPENDNIKVSITLPELDDKLDYGICHIDDEGNEEVLETTTADGVVTFETESFSTFAIIFSDNTKVTAKINVHFVNGMRDEITVPVDDVNVNYKVPLNLESLARQLWEKTEVVNKQDYVFSHVYLKSGGTEKRVKYIELNRSTYNSDSGSYRVWFYINDYTDTNVGGDCAGLFYTFSSYREIADNIYFVFHRINDVSFTKTDDGGSPLSGALFGLYKDIECNSLLAENTSDNRGRVTFKGIPYGTYYLKEINPPSGFNRVTTVFTVKVDRTVEIFDEDTAITEIVNKENDGRIEIYNTRKVVVKKKWNDTANHSKDSVRIELYDVNDSLAGYAVLNSGNSWTGTINVPDSTQIYFLRESNVTINGIDKTHEYKASIELSKQDAFSNYVRVDTFIDGEYLLQFDSNKLLSTSNNDLSVSRNMTESNFGNVIDSMIWIADVHQDSGTLTLQNKSTGKYLSVNQNHSWIMSDAPLNINFSFVNDKLYLYYNTAYIGNYYNYFLNIVSGWFSYSFGSSQQSSSVMSGGTAFNLYEKITTYESEYMVTNSENKYNISFKKADYYTYNPLSGAAFDLYDDSDTLICGNLVSGEDGLLKADGNSEFTLSPGGYYLKEIMAPQNYSKLSMPVKFTISEYGRIRVDEKEFEDFNYINNNCIVIPNDFLMPAHTGYSDRKAFYAMAAIQTVCLVTLAVLLIRRKRCSKDTM